MDIWMDDIMERYFRETSKAVKFFWGIPLICCHSCYGVICIRIMEIAISASGKIKYQTNCCIFAYTVKKEKCAEINCQHNGEKKIVFGQEVWSSLGFCGLGTIFLKI